MGNLESINRQANSKEVKGFDKKGKGKMRETYKVLTNPKYKEKYNGHTDKAQNKLEGIRKTANAKDKLNAKSKLNTKSKPNVKSENIFTSMGKKLQSAASFNMGSYNVIDGESYRASQMLKGAGYAVDAVRNRWNS